MHQQSMGNDMGATPGIHHGMKEQESSPLGRTLHGNKGHDPAIDEMHHVDGLHDVSMEEDGKSMWVDLQHDFDFEQLNSN